MTPQTPILIDAHLRELSDAELTGVSEMELRAHFQRLLTETRRVRREIERRMTYATELSGGPAYRRKVQPSGDQLQREQAAKRKPILTPEQFKAAGEKQQAAELKRVAAIRQYLAVIAQQVKLGNVTQAHLDAIKLNLGVK